MSLRPLTLATFEDIRDAEDALYYLDRTILINRELEVQFAEGDRKTPSMMRGKEKTEGSYGGRRRDDFRGDGYSSRRRSRSRSPRRRRHRSRSKSRSRSPVRRRSHDSRRERREKEHEKEYHSRSRSKSRSRTPEQSRSPSPAHSGSVQYSDKEEDVASRSPTPE